MQDTRNTLAGVGWMLLAGLTFVAMNGIVRHIGAALPAIEIAFMRFAFGLPLLAMPLVVALRRGFPAATWRLFGLRGALHAAGVIFWFYAMSRITLAEVTAIGYLNPVIVIVGAALLLGERLSLARIAAIVVALCGALMVLRPGLRALQPAHAAQVGAAILLALSYLTAKRLAGLARPGEIVAIMTFSVTLILAPLALYVWVPPSAEQFVWMFGAATVASTGHYCMARAFAAAPISVTQPVTFLQLVWASLLGVLAFGDPVDPWVLLGGFVMIAAISAVTWHEARSSALRLRPV